MRTSVFLLFILFSGPLAAQSLIGAWQFEESTDTGQKLKVTIILTEGYQVATWYDVETGAFVKTNGGSWSMKGSTITEVIEFDSENNERVGSEVSFDVEWDGNNKMRIVGRETWLNRIDDGATPGALAGAWLMSGRKRNGEGEVQSRDTSRPRKTMKILSGTRFQWIAYNTETKEFKGTGGGNYTTIDGRYTENIEFFSRDDSRVGASLPFNYELVEKDWHHSGKSSKGAPIYEVWSLRSE